MEKRFLNLTKAEWKENIDSLVWAVVLALAIRTFIIAPFKIPSGSMRPTLIEGDRILVTKYEYRLRKPQRGDIVVFYYPNEWHSIGERFQNVFDRSRPSGARFSQLLTAGRPFIKRLVGLGGDKVEIRGGKIYVNGAVLDSNDVFRNNLYVNDGIYGRSGEVIDVPEGSYFVLGDNSNSSHDSRFWGFVPKRLLIGRALCIFWPVRRWRAL